MLLPARCPRLVSAELLLAGKLSEYGVTVPFSADCRGRFLSHVVSGQAAGGGRAACPPVPRPSRRRVPRSPRDEPPARRGAAGRLLYFNVTVFGKELHLRLRPNRRLVPPGAVAEWQEDFEVLFREPLQQRCLFTGDISGMPGAAVAISNCDGLVRPGCWGGRCALLVVWGGVSLQRGIAVARHPVFLGCGRWLQRTLPFPDWLLPAPVPRAGCYRCERSVLPLRV